MKYLRLLTTDPYLNLAIEEYLFNNSNDDIFMLWQNYNTVVIGKNQNAHAEINEEYSKENDIKIARRITGGGAVYHDLGNVNYTFISSKRGSGIDFKYFTKPIIDALFEMGISAELSGRNDILVDGKKISGNAQHTSNGRVLHHGTLLFNSDLSVLSSVLNVDEEKIRARALKSTKSRVTNIKPYINSDISTEEFIQKIESFVIKSFSPEIITVPNSTQIEELRARNASYDWIFPKSEFLSSYNIIRKKRYDFGIVEISIEMFDSTIKSLKLTGDFFELNSISSLENALAGIKFSEISTMISTLNIGDYILGMTNAEFLELVSA